MITKYTTKTEKYLNFKKFFWNKLSKPWRHHLKSLNNRKIIVWFNKTLKSSKEWGLFTKKTQHCKIRKQNQTRTKMDKLKNTITLFLEVYIEIQNNH